MSLDEDTTELEQEIVRIEEEIEALRNLLLRCKPYIESCNEGPNNEITTNLLADMHKLAGI